MGEGRGDDNSGIPGGAGTKLRRQKTGAAVRVGDGLTGEAEGERESLERRRRKQARRWAEEEAVGGGGRRWGRGGRGEQGRRRRAKYFCEYCGRR